ncbi:MAG: hypothetical protein WC518_00310 [Patescibacteria group bacterium]
MITKRQLLRIILPAIILLAISLLPKNVLADKTKYTDCVNQCYTDYGNRENQGLARAANDSLLITCQQGCRSFLAAGETLDQFSGPVGINSEESKGSISIKLNVPLGSKTTASGLEDYLAVWFSLIIGAVGVLAAVMVMWGGFKWLASRGNSSEIGQAKEIIISALIGLVLAFLSFTILYLINPKLTVITMPHLDSVQVVHTNLVPRGISLSVDPNGLPGPYYSQAKVPCSETAGGVDYYHAFTASYEGYNSTPYADLHGYTYGFGHNSDQRPNSVDYETEKNWFWNNYNNTYWPGAANAYGDGWERLDPQAKAVLADTAYQFGPNSVFLSETASRIRAGDRAGAAQYMRTNYLNFFKTDPGMGVSSRINSNANILESADGEQQFINRAQTSCL